jgi:hypothetical protein
VRCKGYRRLCGLPKCPILERFRVTLKTVSSIKGRTVFGATPPSVIVGEKGYPQIPVIYNLPPGVSGSEAKSYEDPVGWWGVLSLDEIIRRRSYQVASIIKVKVGDFEKLYEMELSPAAVSLKPVESEVYLKRSPHPKLTFSAGVDPVGPSAPADSIKVVGDAKLYRKLEKIIYDDVSSLEAVPRLYEEGVDVYTLIRAVSLGMVGKLRRRKLVPTRWAITAVDNLLINSMLKGLRNAATVNNVEVYRSEYLGNKFTIILYPGTYGSEWIEVWFPLSVFASKSERPLVVYNRDNFKGRTLTVDGGYDAARIALVEALTRRRRVASAIIIREVLPTYYASIGNWHIRESVRAALRSEPLKFSTLDGALRWVKDNISPAAWRTIEGKTLKRRYKSLEDFVKGR